MTYLLVTPTRCEPVIHATGLSIEEAVAFLDRTHSYYVEILDERGVPVLCANSEKREVVGE